MSLTVEVLEEIMYVESKLWVSCGPANSNYLLVVNANTSLKTFMGKDEIGPTLAAQEIRQYFKH